YVCRESSSRPKAFLVLDGPNTDHITSRALASRRFEITVTGPGGHSWNDNGVGNPVHALSQAIASFAAAADDDSENRVRSSFNCGLIHGGTSVNCVPADAVAKVDLRSESSDKLNRMAARLAETVEDAARAENLRASGAKVASRIKEIGTRPGGELAPGS